jgi:hypothetical protein
MSSIALQPPAYLLPNLGPLGKLDIGKAPRHPTPHHHQALPSCREGFGSAATSLPRLAPSPDVVANSPSSSSDTDSHQGYIAAFKDTMSAAYHVARPEQQLPRAHHIPAIDHGHLPPPAMPVHPDPYGERAVAHPSAYPYPRMPPQLPDPCQSAALRSLAPAPARTGSVSTTSLASYRTQGRGSQTASPTRSFTGPTVPTKTTAQMLTQSGTFVPASICANATAADIAADVGPFDGALLFVSILTCLRR